VFPGFRATERLHTSSRSTVDRVVRLVDGATVIMKQPADDVVLAEAQRRLEHEFDLLCTLRGTGVVEAFAIVRDGNHAALIIEDLGDVLQHRVGERRLPLAEVLDIGIELARSLARIHAIGVVHKDVNPNNIIYDPATRLTKLIDFDIASVNRRASAPGPSSPTLEGTLRYLAPEQTGRLNRAQRSLRAGRDAVRAAGRTLSVRGDRRARAGPRAPRATTGAA